MFGTRTDEKMPDAYLHDHAAWDGFIGHIWHNLLYFLDFNPKGTVVEAGPGASVKIAAALAETGFSGDLYIIDATQGVIENLKPRYEALLPHARLHWVCDTIGNSLDALPAQAECFLASHILDDMIIHATAPEALAWSKSYTHIPTEQLAQSWREIEKDSPRLTLAKQNVRHDLLRLMSHIRPRCAIINQYPSSTLYDNGLATLNDHGCEILEELRVSWRDQSVSNQETQNILSQTKNYNNKHIGEHVLNAGYWLLCRQN